MSRFAPLTAGGLAALAMSCSPAPSGPSVPVVAVPTAVPPPLVVRWEQEVVGNRFQKAGPGEQDARIVVDDVLIHFPEEGVWKACRFNGEVWVAPKGAERRTIRVQGRVDYAVGWGLTPGHWKLGVTAWTDSPKGDGNGTYGWGVNITSDETGGRFTAEVWSRGGDELTPYLDLFSGDGPIVDVDLPLFQYGFREVKGGPLKAYTLLTAKIKVMVAYP